MIVTEVSMHTLRLTYVAAITAVGIAGGCGGGNESCDPTTTSTCSGGHVCEVRQSGGGICAEPLVLRGKVTDQATGAGIAGARVVALDANGAPASTVAITGTDGSYELQVPTRRDDAGNPVSVDVTLRVVADHCADFPSGLRQALPITTANPSDSGGKFVVMSSLTNVTLACSSAGAFGTLSGKVQLPSVREGVLVVAELQSGGPSVGTAIADRDGNFVIFNRPAGSYKVTPYARNVNYDPASVNVTAGQTTGVGTININAKPASTVSGNVNIVNPGTGNGTSVILVVESTFSAALARGEAPPGLRAPDPGIAPNVLNAFSIAGVPEGRYVVLAAFENDNLVRDPDTSIAGTQIVHVQVTSGQNLTIPTQFKVTGALDVIMPGRDGPEAVTGKPTLSWVDDAGENGYTIVVYDGAGNLVWGPINEPKHTGSNPAVPYQGPLEPGIYYQFRATSYDIGGVNISSTEDLRGVFYLP
jgi:hypothetical protein